jgi:acetoin utilization deacetylase AcuC-like enzyme
MTGTGIAFDATLKQHDPGPGHPEQPARLVAAMSRLPALTQITTRPATDDDLALVHTRSYIQLVEREVAQHRSQLSTGDTAINGHSATCARVAAGCALSAVDAVFSRKVRNAFCVVRPPGHHASAARGMGFCLFNTVAIAARHAQRAYGAERVLIADWDVHHGNGTQDIFYEDGSVLFFSTHQSPWYPGTGARGETGTGAGAGKTVNCPLSAGSAGRDVLSAFRELLVPAAAAFHPDLILVSAGFDSRIGDPLGQFLLTDDDFRQLTRLLLELADTYCDGRLISVLEGGYSLDGLARASEAHVQALISTAASSALPSKLQHIRHP